MIKARFFRNADGQIRKVELVGHADFVSDGIDPLCAAVTGMVTLVANTLTEVLGLSCKIRESEGNLSMALPEEGIARAQDLLLGLQVQLQDYQEQFPEHIRVIAEDGKGKQSC